MIRKKVATQGLVAFLLCVAFAPMAHAKCVQEIRFGWPNHEQSCIPATNAVSAWPVVVDPNLEQVPAVDKAPSMVDASKPMEPARDGASGLIVIEQIEFAAGSAWMSSVTKAQIKAAAEALATRAKDQNGQVIVAASAGETPDAKQTDLMSAERVKQVKAELAKHLPAALADKISTQPHGVAGSAQKALYNYDHSRVALIAWKK